MSEYIEDEFDDEEARKKRIFFTIIIILIIIVVVLTFGWFYWRDKKQKEDEREKKKQRLDEVEALISILQAKREKIESTEKIIKIGTRFGLAILLILSNCQYAHSNITHFYFGKDIGELLNLNACIISVYTFIAFISYGSIDNFVRRMKEILVGNLKKYHMFSIEELEALYNERDQLNFELDQMEPPPAI